MALTRWVDGRFALLAGILLGVGVVLRLILIWTTTGPTETWSLVYPGYGDGDEYGHIAVSLGETHTFGYAGRATAFRSPAYPALIALTWTGLGRTFTPIRLLQVGMFVLMTALYARAVATRLGKTAGVLTVALMSVHPMFMFMTTEIATESLYMVLESGAFALTLALLEPGLSLTKAGWISFGAGLCFGAGALTRPNMFIAFIVVAIAIVGRGIARREEWRRWFVPLLALSLGTYAVVTPWLIRNQRTIGSASLATNIDYNLFRGSIETIGSGTDKELAAMFRHHGVMYEGEIENIRLTTLSSDEASNERRARAEALKVIRSDPAHWIRERIRNIAYLWLNLQWVGDYLESPFMWLAQVSTNLFYYFLLAAAVAGSLSLGRRRAPPRQREFVMACWCFIVAVMPVVLTIVGKRYRVAMIDPFLVMLASAAVASWIGAATPSDIGRSSDRMAYGSQRARS